MNRQLVAQYGAQGLGSDSVHRRKLEFIIEMVSVAIGVPLISVMEGTRICI